MVAAVNNKKTVEESETEKTRQLESAAEITDTNHKDAQNRCTKFPHAEHRAVGIKNVCTLSSTYQVHVPSDGLLGGVVPCKLEEIRRVQHVGVGAPRPTP